MAVNPEFMREGSSLRDFAQPPLTLVGSEAPQAGELLRELYAQVEAPFVQTSIRSAEMAKYVSNAFHALKITFANEIGDFCEALGVDAAEVMRVFMLDRKLNISEAYLRPGFAFGGSCLPKDLRALGYAARGADLTLPVLSQILPSNDRQIQQGVNRVLATRRRRVGVLGLAFKPGTDDLRESPMVLLVETLIGKGCDVRILDRSVSIARLGGANRRYIEEEIPHIASLMCETTEALLAHAEVLVVANADEQAREALAAVRPEQVVIDLSRGTTRRMIAKAPHADAGAGLGACRSSALAGGLNVAGRSRWRSRRLLILCYHGFALEDEHRWNPSIYVTQRVTSSRGWTFLAAEGYMIVSLGDGLSRLARWDPSPSSCGDHRRRREL